MYKIKYYVFYTPSHKVLLDDWFLPSLKDDYELVIVEHEQKCATAGYMSDGWTDTMIFKTDLIISAIKENEGRIFIHSDVDIQFFKPTKKIIITLLKDKDMVVQRDSFYGNLCPGYFAAYGNQNNLNLWQDVRNELLNCGREKNDQGIMNELLLNKTSAFCKNKQRIVNLSKKALRSAAYFFIKDKILFMPGSNFYSNPYGLKWGYFSPKFYSPGFYGKVWNPELPLIVPPDIVLHHANWTVGVANKIAQLRYVKNLIQR